MKAIKKDIGKTIRVSTETHATLSKLSEKKDFSIDDLIQWMFYKLRKVL